MKKRIISFLVIFIMMVGFLPTLYFASAATYGDLSYEIVNGEVIITDCKESVTTVNIPSKIEGYPVTAIGNRAFYYRWKLENITIPDSVITIGDWVFESSGLKSITIPDSVKTIGERTFFDCSSLESVIIGDGVITIGKNAFQYCTKLESVTIGKSVTTIDNSAFTGCHSIEEITIPSSVTTIGENAFSNCDGLESIIIPDSVTTIDGGAFSDCNGLKCITIPDGITSIANGVFSNCYSLEDIIIPDSVTTIEKNAFSNCDSLETVKIPCNVTSIGNYAFYNCYSLKNITIPYSTTSIGRWAFNFCNNLKTVYYYGTEEDCAKINIEDGNSLLLTSTWIYHEHSWGEYTSDNNATTEKDGTKTRACSVCGHKETVVDAGTKLKPNDISKIFSDIKVDKWYTSAVDYAYTHGFIAGVSATEFGRDVPVTRGMFITILARIAGVDTGKEANKASTKFADVKNGKYYTAAIKWASENGVVNGITATTFEPETPIERQQLCVMIVNFAKHQGVKLTAAEAEIVFKDASSISKYARAAVKSAQMADIVNGYANGDKFDFRPKNTATRAEAAQILYKFHKDYVA